MTSLKVLAKGARKVVSNNAPAILTGLSVVGVAATTIMAVKATPRALDLIEEAEVMSGEKLTPQLKIKTAATCYIPALGMGMATMACVVGANTIGSKRNAALISAYSLSEGAFKEYKDKVVKTLGESKEQKVRDEIAQDKVSNNPPVNSQIIMTNNGEVLCRESMSGRYFESSIETLRKAQNDINAQIINEMYASVNDFYRLIGLEPTKVGDELGWSTNRLLELDFSTVMSTDNRPCVSVDYRAEANRGYHKFG